MGPAGGALTGTHDAVHILHSEQQGRARGPVSGSEHLLLRKDGEVHDHAEQVVEVMRDSSRKLPEALEALGLVQLALQLLSLGYVLDHRDPSRTASVEDVIRGD